MKFNTTKLNAQLKNCEDKVARLIGKKAMENMKYAFVKEKPACKDQGHSTGELRETDGEQG